MNGTKLTMNGTRPRQIGLEKDTNSCKIVLLGCPGVGKTALTVRFMTKRFIGEYCPTLESIHKFHSIIDSEEVMLEILDTAGLLADTWKDYYAFWGDCYIFVYSINDRRGFEEIINLKRQVENLKHSPVYGLLVGNKSDLLHDRQVPESEATELADEIGCKFYELSAADWTQVTVIRDLFYDAVRLHRKSKVTRDLRVRRASSSVRFRQAIQKVITGKPSPKRPSTS